MSTTRQTDLRTEMQKAEQFNRDCPVGTKVYYWPGLKEGSGKLSTTRSTAWVCASGHAVLMVHGQSGWIGLTHVEVADIGGGSAA